MTTDGAYQPSWAAVNAAMEAWNRAEPKHQVQGPSWVTTFVEVLVAAHEVEHAEALDELADLVGLTERDREYVGLAVPRPGLCLGCRRQIPAGHARCPSRACTRRTGPMCTDDCTVDCGTCKGAKADPGAPAVVQP
ncbi:MAG: hypothetical protein JWO69_2023 [Thermoleophilia bacterium]|nr:hypothetical protein [Thermoleophilia bacterium]